MSGIKQPLQDILNRLSGLQVQNNDLQTVGLYARVFNNQVVREANATGLTFPKPAAFVEMVSPQNYRRAGTGVDVADVVWRIHLVHEFYDAQDGTLDQDLLIYDLRDQVVMQLSGYQPTGCSNLVKTAEQQDYNHNNSYAYLIDFTCAFADSKASAYDSASTRYNYVIPTGGSNISIQK